MRRWKWLAASVVIVLSAPLASCAADEGLLAVELATDGVAGIAFIGTQVRVQRDGALAGEASDVAVLGDAFIPPGLCVRLWVVRLREDYRDGACARTIEGTRCGSPTCDPYGACSYPACETAAT